MQLLPEGIGHKKAHGTSVPLLLRGISSVKLRKIE